MDWTRGHVIGHGSSATVFLAAVPHSGDVFAVKSAELSRSESLQREQRLLSSLTCPYLIGYRGFDVSRENSGLVYNLFMEYVPGGSLVNEIRRRGGRLDESLIGVYTQQLVQGLQYIHSKDLVHCDIKPRNVLIGEHGAKIADFGCAKWAGERAPMGGTPLFMAPEVARGEEQGLPSDIWALGCTVIEMSTGGSPWPELAGPIPALYKIGYSDESPEIPSFLSDEAKDFLGKCLRRNPEERWTANQLVKHPFLEEYNSSPKQIQQVYSDSPTTVLDQGVWSSMEESTHCSKGNTVQRGGKCSPAEQIGRLSLSSGEPRWREEEGWIRVRCFDIGKSEEVGGGDDEGDMIGGSAKVCSENDELEEKEGSGGGKEWLELEFLDNNVSCRMSRNHSCRKMSLVHNNLTSHTHSAKFLALFPTIL